KRDMMALSDAVEMAGYVKSIDLLEDLRNAFPEAIAYPYDPDCGAFKRFLVASAESGFRDGLDLIPSQHRILGELDTSGKSLLRNACMSGHAPAVELLLNKGATVNLATADGSTEPLLFLAIWGRDHDFEIVRLLLQHGEEVNRHFHMNDETALHWAVERGYSKVSKLLLDFGADVEAFDFMGRTPLSAASRMGQLECVRVLLDAGADVEATDEVGKTALTWACSFIDQWAPVVKDKSHVNGDLVKMLLEAGAKVDSIDGTGDTPLHHAMRTGRAAAALALVDAGADLTIKNIDGFTPLMSLFPTMFTRTWNPVWEELLDRLIDKGADLQELWDNKT
ncbi:Palmitoyltransferase zdhhc13, partial [Phlyctochytrium bullatum]